MPQAIERIRVEFDKIKEYTGPDGTVPAHEALTYHVRRGKNWVHGIPVGCSDCGFIETENWVPVEETYYVRPMLPSGQWGRVASVDITPEIPSDYRNDGSHDAKDLDWPDTKTDVEKDTTPASVSYEGLILSATKLTGTYESAVIDLATQSRWDLRMAFHSEYIRTNLTFAGFDWNDVEGTFADLTIGGFPAKNWAAFAWNGPIAIEHDWYGNNIYNPTASAVLEMAVSDSAVGPWTYSRHLPGVYECRYVKFRITLTRENADNENIYISTAKLFYSNSLAGNVVGPVSSTDERIAVYDGTTGLLVKDGGVTIAEIATAVASTYLKLDASNDPMTGSLSFQSAYSVVDAGLDGCVLASNLDCTGYELNLPSKITMGGDIDFVNNDLLNVGSLFFDGATPATTGVELRASDVAYNYIVSFKNDAGLDGAVVEVIAKVIATDEVDIAGVEFTGTSLFKNSTTFNDNVELYFGTGKDASILHDGSNLIVDPFELGSGNILLAPSGGNVAIGPNTPGSELEVSASAPMIMIRCSGIGAGPESLRFSERSDSWQGAFTLYDAANNLFKIGVHNTSDELIGSDIDAIIIPRANGYVGIGGTPTIAGLEIFGSSGIDSIQFYHDEDHAFIQWTDGRMRFISAETNANSYLTLFGNGTGYGVFRMYDEDDAEFIQIFCSGGYGYIDTTGVTPKALHLQSAGNNDVRCFSAGGGTNSLQVNGNVAVGFIGTPAAQVESLNASGAQLRLTNTLAVDYADFETDSDGYLDITASGTRVGINFSGSGFAPDYAGLCVYGGGFQVGVYQDANNAQFRTTKGGFVFRTDEGTDTNTQFNVYGLGTGIGVLNLYDAASNVLQQYCYAGLAFIHTAGSAPAGLYLQDSAHAGVVFFGSAAESKTPSIEISGYKSGDSEKRTFVLRISSAVNDQLDFSGLSTYNFDGQVKGASGHFGGASDYVEVESDGDVNFVGGGGLQYAEISVESNAVATALTEDTPAQVLVFDTNGVSNGSCTPDHTNDHITVGKAGHYLINISMTMNSSGGSGAKIEVMCKKNNGAADILVHQDQDFSGGGSESHSIALSGIADLAANDTVEVWIENEDNDDDYVVEDCSLSVVQIGGT